MDSFYHLAELLITSGAVFFTCYYLVKSFLENENKKRTAEMRMANQNLITPLRLQAYERIALLLERMAPNTLVMRVHKNGMSARFLQAELVKNIRDEFDHNLSQQVYMSQQTWDLVKNAKEEMIRLVNISSTRVSETATGIELAQTMLELSAQLKKLPTDSALERLKKEISAVF